MRFKIYIDSYILSCIEWLYIVWKEALTGMPANLEAKGVPLIILFMSLLHAAWLCC